MRQSNKMEQLWEIKIVRRLRRKIETVNKEPFAETKEENHSYKCRRERVSAEEK